MNRDSKVAVCSRSFSKNSILRKELLNKYINVTFNDEGEKLSGDKLIAFLNGHDKAITALEVLDDTILSQLPELKVVGKFGVGIDMIDLESMERYGKRLGWIGGVNSRSVSELVISFAIALLRHVPSANREVLSGVWRQRVGSYLSGKTVGIIGCGYIGKDLVHLLSVFDCDILINDVKYDSTFCKKHNVRISNIETLLSQSDVVTLHVPFNDSTCNLLTSERMHLMKESSILVNTSRGGIVDEVALKDMLINKKLAGAAFDVFSVEPPTDTELLTLDNFMVTPHIGGSAEEAILAMGRAAIKGLDL